MRNLDVLMVVRPSPNLSGRLVYVAAAERQRGKMMYELQTYFEWESRDNIDDAKDEWC